MVIQLRMTDDVDDMMICSAPQGSYGLRSDPPGMHLELLAHSRPKKAHHSTSDSSDGGEKRSEKHPAPNDGRARESDGGPFWERWRVSYYFILLLQTRLVISQSFLVNHCLHVVFFFNRILFADCSWSRAWIEKSAAWDRARCTHEYRYTYWCIIS